MTQDLARTASPAQHELLTREGLESSAAQLQLLEAYVANVLRADQDYGVIPGTSSKPTLLKPGAANVIAAFNCYPDAHIETETIDLDKGLILYRVRVDVLRMDDGRRRATGQGSCSSYEKKYRYRNALPFCPECGKENIRVSKGGGFYCWQKTGGCGANYHHDDVRITSQPIGQVINDDPMEQANTILKMAVKRAEVDAALRLPGVARFFTQDLEDIQGLQVDPGTPLDSRPSTSTSAPTTQRPPPGRVVDQQPRQAAQEGRTAPRPQTPAQTPAQPAQVPQRGSQAARQGQSAITCSGHGGASMVMTRARKPGHLLTSGKVCYGIPAEAPEDRDSSMPSPDEGAEDPVGDAFPTLAAFQALATAGGASWGAWCRANLHMPWKEWDESHEGNGVAEAMQFLRVEVEL